jgi:hypothetical protein
MKMGPIHPHKSGIPVYPVMRLPENGNPRRQLNNVFTHWAFTAYKA